MVNDLRDRITLYLDWFNDDRHIQVTLLGLLIVAFILRLAVAFTVPLDYRIQENDAVRYIPLARHLLTQGVYGLEPGVPDALVPPGYPLFLAGIFALTNYSLLAVRLAQAILGTLMVWLVFLLGQECVSKRVGLLGSFILAVYPAWVFWAVMILAETFFTVLFLVFTWGLVRSMKSYADRHVIVTGIAFSLAFLTREVLYGLPLIFLLAFWWSRLPWQRVWRYSLLLLATVLLALSPWLVRNYLNFGQVFYSEGSAYLQYRLTGSGYLSPRKQALLQDPSVGEYHPPEYYERYGRHSDMRRLSRLLTEPVTYLRQFFNRLVEFWLHPNGLHSLPENPIVRGGYVSVHIGILALAGVGLIPGLKRRDVAAGNLAFLLMYITGIILFFGPPNPRYNLPFLPIVFIFAANGLLLLVRKSAALVGERFQSEAVVGRELE